jgi:predicted enzyme related to lactoylglutathione lyase
MSEHRIVHIEFPATDGSGASQFYGDVFGWKRESAPGGDGGDYWMFQPEDGPGGGFNPVGDQGLFPVNPGEVLVYVGTDNIEDSLSKIEGKGGKTVVARQEIPGMGWYAIFADPTGNRVGLFEGGPQAAQ